MKNNDHCKIITSDFIPKKLNINNVVFSNETFNIIAGPCSVEDSYMIDETACFLSELGIKIIRGGAFKPRTSPYSFQGLGKKGIEYLFSAAKKYNLSIISEAVGENVFDYINEYVDIIQIGSRNSQNFELLKKAGLSNKPILLKRGYMNKIEEFLLSAEYIAKNGNKNIILCERGIRTFEDSVRNTLDISAIPIVKSRTNLPIIVDPSHACGKKDLILPLTKASLAVGAFGVMIEVHPNPSKARSDGMQSLNFKQFENLVKEINFLKKYFKKG